MPINPYRDSWMFESWEDGHTYAMLRRYIIRPPQKLYRLDADLHELHNLAGVQEHREALERLSAELDRWMKKQGDPGAAIDTREEWENARAGNHFRP